MKVKRATREVAENKILSLIKQIHREDESESNKLLQILRERSRNQKAAQLLLLSSDGDLLPGLTALHLHGPLTLVPGLPKLAYSIMRTQL